MTRQSIIKGSIGVQWLHTLLWLLSNCKHVRKDFMTSALLAFIFLTGTNCCLASQKRQSFVQKYHQNVLLYISSLSWNNFFSTSHSSNISIGNKICFFAPKIEWQMIHFLSHCLLSSPQRSLPIPLKQTALGTRFHASFPDNLKKLCITFTWWPWWT